MAVKGVRGLADMETGGVCHTRKSGPLGPDRYDYALPIILSREMLSESLLEDIYGGPYLNT